MPKGEVGFAEISSEFRRLQTREAEVASCVVQGFALRGPPQGRDSQESLRNRKDLTHSQDLEGNVVRSAALASEFDQFAAGRFGTLILDRFKDLRIVHLSP